MRKIILVVLLLSVVLLLNGCMVDRYDNLVAVYQKAQSQAANGRTAMVLGFNKIQNYMDMYDSYLTADVQKTKEYRQALEEFGNKFNGQNQEYLDTNGNPVNPSQIDLEQLVKDGATPADMAITLNSYAITFNEAPLTNVSVESLSKTQGYVSEAYNEIYAAGQDWNKAVEEYNAERRKVSNEVVARAAKALGVNDLPVELPYFSLPLPETQPSQPTLPKMKD